MVTIPPQLDENIRSWHGQEGSDWLAALPAAVAGLADRWRLTVGQPFGDDGAVSWVAPATAPGGSEAVLKVFLPDLENRHEADALRHYGGRGAVRLLEAETGALLLERVGAGASPLGGGGDGGGGGGHEPLAARGRRRGRADRGGSARAALARSRRRSSVPHPGRRRHALVD